MNRPLKRVDALVQFSKDHHFALLLVWKIRQGLSLGVEPARMRAYINFFFENYLLEHFKEEEELLFAELDNEDPLRQKAEKDHGDLQKIHLLLKTQDVPDTFSEFAARLDQHIRFEERILFSRLQNSLGETKLNSIMQRMQELHQTPIEDTWNDMFWINTSISRTVQKIT